MLKRHFSRRTLLSALTVAALGGALPAAAQTSPYLRVATWNVTDYTGGRDADFKTALYGVFNNGTTLDQQFAPDVLVGQEFVSASAVSNFVAILNTASGSPGDWTAAPFINGPDSDSALFYRTSKITYLSTAIVANGTSGSTEQPRNTYRYDIRVDADPNKALLDIYSVHLKSGTPGSASDPTSNAARRALETSRIRANANTLGTASPNTSFMVVGDYNIPSSTELAYQNLVGSQTDNAGRLFDPIASPGTWNNNATYKYIHTQDPTSAMDDRFDQLLISNNLMDGSGLDYAGNPFLPYSTTTWNDPNHRYRVWGNDGTSYNTSLKVNGNTMVGSTIAQALINSVGGSATGGHLPVYIDLRLSAAPVPEFSTGVSTLFYAGVFGTGLLVRRRRRNGYSNVPKL